MNPAASPGPMGLAARNFRALLAGLVTLGLPALAADSPAADTKPPTAEAPKSADAQPAEPAKEAKEAEKSKDGASEEKPDQPASVEAAPGEFRSWFNVSVGGLIVDGNEAAAQRRLGLPASAFGGVQDFHFEQDVGKKGVFKIDGRGIFDNEDYRLRLDYTDSDKGYVRGGIEQHRDYYDGSGGWAPSNGQWFDLYDDRLELLRSSAFFEAGLRMANLPELTVRYQHDSRDGYKDSTSWGDSGLTGGVGVRAFVPTLNRIDETSDTVSVDLRHTIGKVTFGGAFAYENDDLDNARLIRRRPDEPSDRHVTQTEKVERDLYSARAFVDTILNDKVRLSTAYLYTTLDTVVGGNRIVGSDYDAVYDPVNARRDVGFLNLVGGSELDQNVWNVNGMWKPIPSLAIIPAFRIENQTLDGSSSWTDTGSVDIPRDAANSRDMLDLSQQLEVRYTGITNIVVYARGDWVQGDGNLLENQFAASTGGTEIYRDSDFDRFAQKYTGGVHWYPLRQVNVHAQYYRKMRNDDYEIDPASYVNFYGAYPGFIRGHDFTTDDANIRVTWRPLDKLTLTTRYDYQISTVEMQAQGLPAGESGENTAHILGETITWTPISRLYIQPGVNFILDTTRSPASEAVASPLNPVADADNNYVNVTCTVGVVLDDKTDLQTQYTYYLADNFDPSSAYSQPYGAGLEEHGILTSLIRRITPKLRVTLRYGYYTSSSDMTGGHDDYDAHLLYSSLQYLF